MTRSGRPISCSLLLSQSAHVYPILCTRTTTQINTIQLTETRGIPLFSLCVVVKIGDSTFSNYDPVEIILFFY